MHAVQNPIGIHIHDPVGKAATVAAARQPDRREPIVVHGLDYAGAAVSSLCFVSGVDFDARASKKGRMFSFITSPAAG